MILSVVSEFTYFSDRISTSAHVSSDWIKIIGKVNLFGTLNAVM